MFIINKNLNEIQHSSEEEWNILIERNKIFISEDYSLLENIAKALEEFNIDIVSYEGNSDYYLKLQQRINNTKKNSASDFELKEFAEFIADGVDVQGLIESYEEEVADRLYGLTDEELQKEKEFYEYEVDSGGIIEKTG